MINLFNYLASNPGNIMVFWTILLFALIAVLIYLNRRIFIDIFKNVSKSSWVILLLCAIIFSFLVGLNFKTFSPSDQEWEELYNAKRVLLGDRQVFNQGRYGLMYPLLLALNFKLFGVNIHSAIYLNLFLAIASIFLVFIITKIIFNSDVSAFYSALFYLSTPLVFGFTAVKMGFPTTVGFFFLLIILAAVLAFRYHKFSLYLLVLILISIISQVKPEYSVLIVPFVLSFFIFREYKYLSPSKIILLFFIFCVSLTPFLIKNIQLRQSFSNPWCGTPSQSFYNDQHWFYNSFIGGQLDIILKFFLNNRFSFNYFYYDLPNFIKFWTLHSFIVVLPFLLLGLLASFARYFRKYAAMIFLMFCSISFIYLADCAFYEQRYAIATYGSIVLFAGYGLSLLQEKLSKKTGIIISQIIPLIVFVLIGYLFSSYVMDLKTRFNISSIYYNDYNYLRDLSRYFTPNSNILVVHRNEMMILRFLDYTNVDNLSDYINNLYFDNREEFFKTLELTIDPNQNNYFIKSSYCNGLKPLQDMCEFVESKYIDKIVYSNQSYTIYLLKSF